MGRVLAVCNQKGGVGKTTTAVNLSAALALAGQRVLLVDSDAQANATRGVGLDPREVQGGLYEALLEEQPLEGLVVATSVAGLDVVPATMDLTGAEIALVQEVGREQRLRAALQPVRERYAYLLVDCPPSLGLLTINALGAADAVLIPMQCEYYALEGLTHLLKTIDLVRRRLNPDLAIEGIVLTMADRRTRLAAEVIAEVRSFFKEKVYDTVIPRSIRLSEAPSHGKPVLVYDPDCSGAKGYGDLCREFLQGHPLGQTPVGAVEVG